jgi:terminal oxidase subunit
LSSIGINNYLVNVTSNDPNAQQQYVVARNYTLPFPFGIYRVNPNGSLAVVSEAPLRIDATVTELATLVPGVYFYGLIEPVAYEYNPNGESGSSTGIQTGLVMGLWGVLWVGP